MPAQDDNKPQSAPPRVVSNDAGISPLRPEDNPQIQAVQKRITELTGRDRQVIQTSLGQSSQEARDVYDRTIRHFERQEWDNFIAFHPELAELYKNYEPVAQAFERKAKEAEVRQVGAAWEQQQKELAERRAWAADPKNQAELERRRAQKMGINEANQRIEAAKAQAPLSPLQEATARIENAARAGHAQSPNERIAQAAATPKPTDTAGLILPIKKNAATLTAKTSASTPASVPQMPISRMSPPQNKQPISSAAPIRGIAGIRSVGKIGASIARAGMDARGASQYDLTFLEPAYKRWRELLRIRWEWKLDKIKRLEEFKEWLLQHPGAMNPVTKRPLSTDDWKDHDAYHKYLEISEELTRKRNEAARQKERSAQTARRSFFVPVVGESISQSNVKVMPPPPPLRSTGITPPVSSPGSGIMGGSGSTPPPRRGGGMGGLTKGAAGKLANYIPQVRVATTIWKNKELIIGGAILLLVLLFAILSGSAGDLTVTQTESTQTVESPGVTDPQANGLGYTAPAVAGISTFLNREKTASGPGVLAATDQDFDQFVQQVIRNLDSRITYTVTINYTGQADDIIVTYPIPSNAFFLSATGKYTVSKTREQFGASAPAELKWSVKDNPGASIGSIPGSTTGTNSSSSSSSCGPVPKLNGQPDWSDWSCNGFVGTSIVKSGWYKATGFGCELDGQGPGNCDFACDYSQIPECNGKSGWDCEHSLKYFAADSDRYGCGTKLRLSNPENGKSVVVRVIDRGPNCSYGGYGEVPNGGPILDMSKWAVDDLGIGGNYELVHVDKVDESVPVGPLSANACTASSNSTGSNSPTSNTSSSSNPIATSGNVGIDTFSNVGIDTFSNKAAVAASPVQTSVDISRYTQSPYNLPTPNGSSDITVNDALKANINRLGAAVAKFQTYLTSKVKNNDPKYVDPFLSVIWTGAVEGIGGDNYFWNCQDASHDINAGCSGGFYSGGWQVGYGVQVSQAVDHLAEDFEAAYGGGASTTASKVAQVGQAVINNSGGRVTNPRTFPTQTISSLVAQAKNGNEASQQAIAILLMDPDLGAITLAREIAGDIAAQDNWSATMRGWAPYYSQNMQLFSNRMKTLAEIYTGVSTGGNTSLPGGGNQSFPPTQFQITLVPLVAKGVFVSNRAYADVVNGRGTGSGSATDSASAANPSEIMSWASKIAQNLQPSYWNYYNKMLGDVGTELYVATKRNGVSDQVDQLGPDGLYWCTFIVIDSYNLVGKHGLVPSEHLEVTKMIQFFKSTPGYIYLDYDRQDHKSILQKVKPGYAFFMMAHDDTVGTTGQEHTGLVKEISYDANGNGYIDSTESNSDQTGHRFIIENWNIVNMFYTPRGFGGT